MCFLCRAHEISERNRIAYEEELSMQKLDNMKANQQMEALKEFEEQFVNIVANICSRFGCCGTKLVLEVSDTHHTGILYVGKKLCV